MSNGIFPRRLTKIDDLIRSDHFYLAEDDDCYFFGEYTARGGYSAGPTNQFIHNFKKGMDRRGRPEWRYKERSISEAARAFSQALNAQFVAGATLVPMPPSKSKNDPRYDDRLLRMLNGIELGCRLDIRELLIQEGSREKAAHDGIRPGPDELARIYKINESVADPPPKVILIFDDLLVTGASFVAAKSVLQARFAGVSVEGFFLARRALPDPNDFYDFVDDDL
jgi:hypothetical protein